MKVLISAYVCSPASSSEAEVGWQWVSRLSEFHEIVVITKKPNSLENVHKLIEKKKSLRFEYYELPRIFNFLREGDIWHFIYYNLWQIGAYFHARKLVKKENFDLVHHLVYVNTWQPTYMAFLRIPFIYGPLGENSRVPYRIAKHYGWKVNLRDTIISFARYTGKNFSPLMRTVYKRASRIIVINSLIYSKMRGAIKKKTFIHPAVGVSISNTQTEYSKKRNENEFKILYIGRFVYLKCPDLALEAFLKFADGHDDVEFTMIGGGKMQRDLEKNLEKHKNAKKVKLIGWIDRKEVTEYMKECDIFFFPTFEGGGMVILEAMSYGKPVICLDFGGPKDFVTDKCGIKVPVSNRIQIIADLADAIEKLYNSEDLRQSMGIAARMRVEEYYTWEKKVEWMNNVYFETVEVISKRP
ncbi:MAG: glycosyltransferase [Nitrospirota bacterium]